MKKARCGGCGKMFFQKHEEETCSSACSQRLSELNKKVYEHNKANPDACQQLLACLQCSRLFAVERVSDYYCSKKCEDEFKHPLQATEATLLMPVVKPQKGAVPVTGLGVVTCGKCNRVVAACKCADRGTR